MTGTERTLLNDRIAALEAERDAYRAVVEKLLVARLGNGLSYSASDEACRLGETVYRVINRVGGASPEMIRGAAGLPRQETPP